MRLTVGRVPVDIEPSSTIAELRQRAFDAGERGDAVAASDLALLCGTKLLDPSATIESAGLAEGAFLMAVRERCMHGSPFDPARGGYLCGWC